MRISKKKRGRSCQGAKKDGESTFTAAVKLPVESAWTGVSAPTILTLSRVAVVLAVMAIAAAPTSPPNILVLEIMCSPSTTAIPKKRLSDNLLFSILQHPLQFYNIRYFVLRLCLNHYLLPYYQRLLNLD